MFLLPASPMPNNHESGRVSRDLLWMFKMVWEGKRSESVSDPSRNPGVGNLKVISASNVEVRKQRRMQKNPHFSRVQVKSTTFSKESRQMFPPVPSRVGLRDHYQCCKI